MKKDPGGDECDYGEKDDGSCYTLAERDAKRDAERDKKAEEEKESEEMAEAAQKRAKDLHGFLTAVVPTVESDRPALTDDLLGAYNAAVKDGTGSQEKASVRVTTTKGADVESASHSQVSDTPSNPGNDILVVITNAKYISGSGFASAEGVVVKHTDAKGEGDREVKGSYRGAMGTFTCADASNDCTSQRTKDGIQLLSTTGWSFTPDTGQKYKVDDPYYAQFGWWLNEAAEDDAVRAGVWYSPGGFAAGTAFGDTNSNLTEAELTAATGSATYTGDAIGQAAFYDGTTDDENIGGAFTATATLTADFEDEMLKGEITGFKVGGVDTDWKVELMQGDIVARGVAYDAASDAKTKWTANGKTAEADGAWGAVFYDVPDNEHQPKGVAGGFRSGHGTEGEMVGAFGAER